MENKITEEILQKINLIEQQLSFEHNNEAVRGTLSIRRADKFS